MDFVNATPAAARLVLTDVDPSTDRMGFAVAKVTYDFGRGWAELDTQSPFPILAEDVQVEDGLLPKDTEPRHDRVFEVVLLGAAYAPQFEPVTERIVSISIGSWRRQLIAIGDRSWFGETPSEAAPFLRMPLTWSRAHGGSVLVEIDDGAFIEVNHLLNPAGRGACLDQKIADTADWLNVPPGYPRFQPELRLPNVERVEDRIRQRSDDPRPAGWAPIEVGSPLSVLRTWDRMRAGENEDAETAVRESLHRATPEMILDHLDGGSVVLDGLAPGAPYEFDMPADRIYLDLALDDREAMLALTPQMCVFLPDRRRFYVVHRVGFRVAAASRLEARLRMG